MPTFLFCTCYIKPAIGKAYSADRYIKYIRYYKKKLNQLGADFLIIIADGVVPSNLPKSIDIRDATDFIQPLQNKVTLFQFRNHLGRPTQEDFRGWWRSFSFAHDIAIAGNFSKIIHIESDFFVLSDKLCNYISSLQSGWTMLYSKLYHWPESAIQIICKDRYNDFDLLKKQIHRYNYNFHYPAEVSMPATHIEYSFLGDRLDTNNTVVQEKFIDYVGDLPFEKKPQHYAE
jgi:hypothetical protein